MQAAALKEALEKLDVPCGSRSGESRKVSVWLDMTEQNLTAVGMEEGLHQSRNVLMFLSDDLMGRPFCNNEQRWAKMYGCNFVGVVETDTRHKAADFATEKARAPDDLAHLLDGVEFIGYKVGACLRFLSRLICTLCRLLRGY